MSARAHAVIRCVAAAKCTAVRSSGSDALNEDGGVTFAPKTEVHPSH